LFVKNWYEDVEGFLKWIVAWPRARLLRHFFIARKKKNMKEKELIHGLKLYKQRAGSYKTLDSSKCQKECASWEMVFTDYID
jgi:hypothetical protein